jgi:hypothetical protein
MDIGFLVNSIVNDELSLLASNIKREVINVLDFFLPFVKVYDKIKPKI